jgi:hypothetical protein
VTFRKPVSEITDRAKRYRANRVKPSGPKRCAYSHLRNPCKGPLGINHADGNESNGKRSNLNWACKRHNAQLALWHKQHGKGVRTRQYNPGASNLAQYVQAAVEHTRGSHDAGGKVIHETPRAKRKAFAREIAFRKGHRNPASTSEDLYRNFHGKKHSRITTIQVEEADYGSHPDLAQLGKLVSLTVGEGVKLTGKFLNIPEAMEDGAWAQEIGFDHNVPDVAAEPAGKQIYFVGGNQDISSFLGRFPGIDRSKELLDLGPCIRLEYLTQKRFDKFQDVSYFHALGEETGEYPGDNGANPRLLYNRIRRRLYLVGGKYHVKPEGIVD